MVKETSEEKIARLRALRLAAEADRPKRQECSRPVYGMRDELRFGKHRGATVEQVLESDPGWIRWALDNIGDFEVSGEVEDELRILDDPRRPLR